MSADLVALPGGAGPVRTATREEAEARATRIRRTLEVVVDDLIDAYRARDYEVLGYGRGMAGWQAYLRDRFGDLKFLLPEGPRRERLVLMHDAGLTTARPIAAVPGMGGKSQTAEDLKALAAEGLIRVDSERVGVDGKRQRVTGKRPTPPPADRMAYVRRQLAEDHLSIDQAVTAAVDHLGEANRYEVAEALGIRDGRASAALSRCQQRRRWLEPAGFRDGVTLYRVARPALEQ